eukprot:jgi/Undpi1/12423/HiC_scaffold_5.g02095.m1
MGTGVIPLDNLKGGGGVPSGVQGVSGGGCGEGEGVSTGKNKVKGKGKEKGSSAGEGKGSGSGEVNGSLLGKDGGGGMGVSAGGSATERYSWIPSLRESKPSRECVRRVKKDIRTLMRDPVHGLFVYPDEDLVTVVHALITGPFDTPYEGGFFYFVLHCPDDYPHSPPKVRLMTTGGGAVRFNPNLYANGKVCLSLWRSMPACFQGLTRDLFLSFVPRYELLCEQNMCRFACVACGRV